MKTKRKTAIFFLASAVIAVASTLCFTLSAAASTARLSNDIHAGMGHADHATTMQCCVSQRENPSSPVIARENRGLEKPDMGGFAILSETIELHPISTGHYLSTLSASSPPERSGLLSVIKKE